MEHVIAIDPGKRTGWAIFADGVLVQADTWHDHEVLNTPPSWPAAVVVIELPVVYPRGLGKGDPNDLIKLAVLVGDLRGYYRRAGHQTALVAPRTWKGSVPKAIHHRRVLGALTPEERQALPSRNHNTLDAVGLGLWRLKR